MSRLERLGVRTRLLIAVVGAVGLALAIGVNSAIFAIINGAVLRPVVPVRPSVKRRCSLPPVALGNSDDERIGEWVLAIGNPLGEGLTFTVTSGKSSRRFASSSIRSPTGTASASPVTLTPAPVA